ncbi:uncharacterized protein LOC120415311 [Culex pipiens pallens]|uniref:uncharacterized protein LOC120415311 n=1 Tax=Culex pipiens pallens TaxID=42434 RepID=UPI001953D68E|nr:uncharacterized protein LOC120415311 [Culex pipiens pallens]
METSTTEEVPCNGPCRKRFRPAAVQLDQTTSSVLLSSARASGLLWLWPECHQAFNLQQPVKRYESDLPPELWKMIFRNLDKRSTLRVRLTCRRWKDIVDLHQSLLKKLPIYFGKDATIDDRFQPENLFPATSARFAASRILAVGAWWLTFGARLTELSLWSCEIKLPAFLRMLRGTPNLVNLSLSFNDYTSTEENEVDFRLEKLKYLYCTEVIPVFESIFPRLRTIDLICKPSDEAKACRLLNAVQGTLKVLDINLTPFVLKQMASMNRLQLTTLILRGNAHLIVQLSRTQVAVEVLFITFATNEALCKIGRNLTKLKDLAVNMIDTGTVGPSFLDQMPQLKRLNLMAAQNNQHLRFQGLKSENLTRLYIDSFHTIGDCLQNFLKNCPNLQILEMRSCSVSSCSDMSLPHNTAANSHGALKTLLMECCQIPTETLIRFLLQCFRVENLLFSDVDAVNDQLIGILNRLSQLKELTVCDCPVTDKSVEFIVENCSHVVVQICCEQISKLAMKLLDQVMRTR